MSVVYISDLELAINWWRSKAPASEAGGLALEVSALASVYGAMIAQGLQYVEEQALSLEAINAFERWAATMPDSPCIAVCSTSVGDTTCTACGRSFDEITRWTAMTLIEKRAVWRRTANEGHWLRFTARYQDRLIERTGS
jgi:uncharacterized protein